MDAAKFLLSDMTSLAASPVKPRDIDTASLAKKEKFAKDFEAIFINKLLGEMKKTIGKWGFEEDGASEQIQGLFWSQLADNIGGNGGLGLWKDIYKSLVDAENTNSQPSVLDKQI